MIIQVNTDNHTDGGAQLIDEVKSVVSDALERFGERITRVEVQISDENSHKGGDDDKRCVMEARLAGHQPVSVTHRGATVDQAVEGAAHKLQQMLTKLLDRLNDPKGRTSYAGEQMI